MSNKSYVDCAYEIMPKTAKRDDKGKLVGVPFPDLLMKVGESMAITDEKTLTDMASKFYTALTMDGRFVLLENNTWVLRQLICFEDVHIDMNDVYSGDEDEDSDEDEDETHAEKEADDDVAEEGEVKDETEEKETDDDVPVPSADDDDDTIA